MQCGKYRISKPDSEGSHPQPGHAGVMESVSRDKSANGTLADVGSDGTNGRLRGVHAPPVRDTAGSDWSRGCRFSVLTIRSCRAGRELVSRASAARPGT